MKQFKIVSKAAPEDDQYLVPAALFTEDGSPVNLGGGGDAVTWSTLSGKPSTFPPTVGTTATTAKAGNYAPSSAEVATALKGKAQVSALAAVSAANATAAAGDTPTKAEFDTLVTLANANKAAINAVTAALKA